MAFKAREEEGERDRERTVLFVVTTPRFHSPKLRNLRGTSEKEGEERERTERFALHRDFFLIGFRLFCYFFLGTGETVLLFLCVFFSL